MATHFPGRAMGRRFAVLVHAGQVARHDGGVASLPPGGRRPVHARARYTRQNQWAPRRVRPLRRRRGPSPGPVIPESRAPDWTGGTRGSGDNGDHEGGAFHAGRDDREHARSRSGGGRRQPGWEAGRGSPGRAAARVAPSLRGADLLAAWAGRMARLTCCPPSWWRPVPPRAAWVAWWCSATRSTPRAMCGSPLPRASPRSRRRRAGCSADLGVPERKG